MNSFIWNRIDCCVSTFFDTGDICCHSFQVVFISLFVIFRWMSFNKIPSCQETPELACHLRSNVECCCGWVCLWAGSIYSTLICIENVYNCVACFLGVFHRTIFYFSVVEESWFVQIPHIPECSIEKRWLANI